MKESFTRPEDLRWKCRRCDMPLEIGTVTVAYMDQEFSAELARCPCCGFVLVSEELALGKMAEVEQILEDK
jgi:hypothetical protein